MQLNSRKSKTATLVSSDQSWVIKSYLNDAQQKFQADTWVQLLELPSTFSFDEALLLCQISEDEWLAWIPDHGEAVLHVSKIALNS